MKSNKSISRNFVFWPKSIFCNFKNGQKPFFELWKSLKLPKMQFHEKKWIYLISRVFLPGLLSIFWLTIQNPNYWVCTQPGCLPMMGRVLDPTLSVTTVQLHTDWNSSQLSCWRLLEFPQWNFVDPFSIDEPHTFDRRPGGRRLQFRRKKDSRNSSSSSWLTRLEFQIFASK